MKTIDATYHPAATSALERASMPTSCECCGREGLKRTVKMTNDSSVMWMGVGCAAKGTGVSTRELNAAERAEQNRAGVADAKRAADARSAELVRWQRHLDARCPEHRGDILRQIRAIGGMAVAREGLQPVTHDPCDMGALLHAAVEAHCKATGASVADIARAAGMAPQNLSGVLRDPNARPPTVRALCRVLGLRVELART